MKLQEELHIHNIRVDDDMKTTTFIIHGTKKTDTKREGVVYYMDIKVREIMGTAPLISSLQ